MAAAPTLLLLLQSDGNAPMVVAAGGGGIALKMIRKRISDNDSCKSKRNEQSALLSSSLSRVV